jgi:hypothetical protein
MMKKVNAVMLLLLGLPLTASAQTSLPNALPNDWLRKSEEEVWRKHAEVEERRTQEWIRESISKAIPPIQVELPQVFAQQQRAKESSNKNPCSSGVVKDDCIGVAIGIDGVTYVGEFKMGLRNGLGVEYFPNGQMSRSGVWSDNTLVNPLHLQPSRFPLPRANQVEAAVSADSNGLFSKPCMGSYKHNCHGSNDQADGSRYTGDWVANFPHGNGVLYRTNGETLAGEWRWGEFIGRPKAVETSPESKSTSQFLAQDESSGQSSLPDCHSRGQQERCLGRLVNGYGGVYVGEIKNDLEHGIGILYSQTGSLSMAGRWEEGRFTESIVLPESRFPFNSTPQLGLTRLSDTGKAERDRLTAEVEAERKKRQELDSQRLAEIEAERKKRQDLEQRLAEAEAKERERQQAQVPQPQRPQVALRNERRLALVIGNSSYKVSPLDNPANDANDVAESLKKFGFQTTLVRNATLGQMREATRKFADQLPSADVALIYFAGHGIESNRKNYMIPVNADLKFEYELADQGYDAGIWLEMLESIKSNNADRVNIVILDACRNNSLIGSRNLGRGLGKMDAPSGTFLAYSTAPGKVAADGGRGERNSPFTKHLIRAMQQPNQPIEEVFKEVRRNVGKETNGAQVPWESTSLTGFFTFRQGR